ncbi:MAG: hypothetical protein GC160_17165 [Acidobacteria bacterium]|nr:hypothetical protein [Acidobacteriota bacterium]
MPVLAALTALSGCGYKPIERSVEERIATTGGESVYVKRLSRGVSYDVMWISASSGVCSLPSQGEDIVFPMEAATEPLYYRLEDDGSIRLFLYGVLNIPLHFPVTIKQDPVHPKDWSRIQYLYERGEIRRLELKIPSVDPCMFRW